MCVKQLYIHFNLFNEIGRRLFIVSQFTVHLTITITCNCRHICNWKIVKRKILKRKNNEHFFFMSLHTLHFETYIIYFENSYTNSRNTTYILAQFLGITKIDASTTLLMSYS